MEKARRHVSRRRLAVSAAVVLLGVVAFFCCVAAEFTKSTAARDLQLDGSLCSLQGSSSFALGITALATLTVAQIAGTSAAAGYRICTVDFERRRTGPIVLMVLSWLSFGIAAVLLGTASSMSRGQAYGKGWLDGECYLVRDGVYIGSAVLVVSAVSFALGSPCLPAAACDSSPVHNILKPQKDPSAA